MDLNEKIASSQASMKLLPPLIIKLGRYKFKGDLVPQFLQLPGCITKLSGMRSHDNTSRIDVTFTFFKVQEMEASLRTPLEAASWIGWWFFFTLFHYGQFKGGGEVLLAFLNGG